LVGVSPNILKTAPDIVPKSPLDHGSTAQNRSRLDKTAVELLK